MPRLSSALALLSTLLLLAGCSSEASPEPTQALQGAKNQPDRWAAHVIMPGEDGSHTFYAYWLDTQNNFAFRRLDGLPSSGVLGALLAPDSTGEEIVVPATHMLALARAIHNSGAYDEAISDPSLGTGVSIVDGQVRVFASRVFTAQEVAELVVLLSLLLICVGVLLVVIRRLRRERAAKREALAARSRMIRVREAERAVLAREIHDGPIQNLHALRLQAHATMLAQEAAKDYALESGLQRVSQELRSIMEGLRPPALDRFGFTAALESHAARISVGNDTIEIKVSNRADHLLAHSDDDFQLGVFRVVQEALSNAVQHGSGRVNVVVDVEDTTLEARVSDDGSGFSRGTLPPPDALMDAGHFGLVGMRERAEVLGGELTFGSSPSGGAAVRLRVPIPAVAPVL